MEIILVNLHLKQVSFTRFTNEAADLQMLNNLPNVALVNDCRMEQLMSS